MPQIYRSAGIGSEAGATTTSSTDIRALQYDLRSLGYLAHGVDGQFGAATRQAIRSLQYDLLHNDGASTAADGRSPVVMTGYNKGVRAVSGIADLATCDSISTMLADAAFMKLPRSATPEADNRAALQAMVARRGAAAPLPFLLAIFQQESGGKQFEVPHGPPDLDDFVVIGLDRAKADQDHVTSRGYGIGQFTIFHHPPSAGEIADFVVSPSGNAQQAAAGLRDKFDHYVTGRTQSTTATDRKREHPLLAMRLCRYAPSDSRYMAACRVCAAEVSGIDIGPSTAVYAGAGETYGGARDYPSPHYTGVPERSRFLCDWPYAVRRYNGDGPDSYNYQARILLGLLATPLPTAVASGNAVGA